jgi:hypothetical protein
MSQSFEFPTQRLFTSILTVVYFIQRRSVQQSYDVLPDENRCAHALTDTDNVKVRAMERKGKCFICAT